MLKDRYGRTIDYMRISVTDRCNLKCLYCVPEKGITRIPAEDLLTDDEIEKVTEAAAGVGISHIKVTGGEPLLRENLADLIQRLRKIPGIETITLTTNGILLPSKIEALVKAGICGVNISLDTLDPQRYSRLTRGGKLSDAMEGLKAVLKYENVTVKVNAVLYEEFWQEDALALSKLAKDMSVHVRFIEHMPLGAEAEERAVLEADILKLLEEQYGKCKECREKIGEGPGHYFTFPGLRGRIGFISAMSHKFCSGCNRVRLTADGNLRMCLQSRDGISLRKLLRSGADKTELTKWIQSGLEKKPQAHQMDAYKIEAEGMCQIGG